MMKRQSDKPAFRILGPEFVGSVVLAAALALSVINFVFPLQASAVETDIAASGIPTEADYSASGVWGTCPWAIDGKGVLTIEAGNGTVCSGLKSPWADFSEKITRVVFKSNVVMPNNCSYLLRGIDKATSVTFEEGVRADDVTNMSYMFLRCSSLRTLDLTPLDLRKLSNLDSAFLGCSSLRNVIFPSRNSWTTVNMIEASVGCVGEFRAS